MPTTTSNAVQLAGLVEQHHVRRADALAEQVHLGRAQQQYVHLGDAGARLVGSGCGLVALLSFLLGFSAGRAARELSGLPSRTRVPGCRGRMTVDLPTLTCTTGAMSTRPHGAAAVEAGAAAHARCGLRRGRRRRRSAGLRERRGRTRCHARGTRLAVRDEAQRCAARVVSGRWSSPGARVAGGRFRSIRSTLLGAADDLDAVARWRRRSGDRPGAVAGAATGARTGDGAGAGGRAPARLFASSAALVAPPVCPASDRSGCAAPATRYRRCGRGRASRPRRASLRASRR